MTDQYGSGFFDSHETSQVPSASAIVPYLCELIKPTSVVDVGCSRGFWLTEFTKAGCKEILGIDGPWVPKNKLAFDQNFFSEQDLNRSIRTEKKYDLAISLEVGEHLLPERAPSFVSDICKIAPVVYFGAAIPGQGGTYHHNEQWPVFWADLFSKNNFLAYDLVRPKFWNNASVTWWYKQNAVLYVQADHARNLQSLKDYQPLSCNEVLSMVHPELFSIKQRYANPGFGKWLRSGKGAIRKSLSKRLLKL